METLLTKTPLDIKVTGRQLPVVYVGGGHYDMGLQIGQQCRSQVQVMTDHYRCAFESAADELGIASWSEAVLHARKYLPFAEEATPQYLDEMRGIADGANVDLDDLLVLNCMEALTSDALHLKCTSLAAASEVTADGSVLVGHNEDWLPDDLEQVYLVHAEPDDEPAFLAMTYGGLLPNIGFNARGIAQCCDSVYPNDARIGVPRIFVSRAVLAAETLADAIRAALHKRRAAGYNHLIVETHGEMYNVEVSATAFATIYGLEGYLAHANHYLTPKMKNHEQQTLNLVGSRVRYNRAQRLMKRHLGKLSVETFQSILTDHVNYPGSICNHVVEEDPPPDQQQTIASLIMDLSNKTMLACWGTPCQGTYYPYRLE